MYWQELTTGIYPWDVHDEGIDTILDSLQEIGCNSAYMIALMHHEKRPCNHTYYDHNPVRKRYLAEDSKCYWLINPKEYENSIIKPQMTDREFLKGTDWLDIMIAGLRKRNMKVGVEISHTPLDGDRGQGEFIGHTQKDIYGNYPGYPGFFSRGHLCWNSKEAREYVCCIARDLVRNHDVDFLQTCSWPFAYGDLTKHPFLGVLLGGCFCEHCEKEARAQGLDWDAIVKKIKHFTDMLTSRTLAAGEDMRLINKGSSSPVMFLIENPEIYQWLKFRSDSLTRYFKELSQAIKEVNPNVEFRVNTCWREPEWYGLNLKDVAKHVDSVRMMDYLEQGGYTEDLLQKKTKWLADVRRQVGEDMPIIGGVAPRGNATPELIIDSIKLLAHEGVDGLSFGFYDCAPRRNLAAIKQGVEEAGVILRD